MTESEWLNENHPSEMVHFMRDKASKRKLRMLSAAMMRKIWHLLTQEDSRTAVEIAEQFADGLVSKAVLAQSKRKAKEVATAITNYSAEDPAAWAASWIVSSRRSGVIRAIETTVMVADMEAREGARQRFDDAFGYEANQAVGKEVANTKSRFSPLVRCVLGNPFRPTKLDEFLLAWSNSTIPNLAQTIYEERRFEDMPILADALTDAGCDNEDILNHCRGENVHVRGCWVLDLMLGKE